MSGPQKARIGTILKKHHWLTAEQVTQILATQEHSHRPFGQLAQRMFGVTADAIEAAWVEQYLQYGTKVDLASQQIDPRVLNRLTRRQAWQLQLLPLRHEDNQLVVATCPERLARSVKFAWRRLNEPVFVVVADRLQLEEHLQLHYPWPAMEHLSCVGPAAVGSG